MTQNMFQEGLYQVFFKERPQTRPLAVSTCAELKEARLVRWFGTVVNTRLLLAGVRGCSDFLCSFQRSLHHFLYVFEFQMLCVYDCTRLVCPALSCHWFTCNRRTEKTKKIKVMSLMGLNILSLLFGISSFITYTLKSTALGDVTTQQRIGVYVVKGSCILFILQCILTAIYTIFLIWRGLKCSSTPYRQDYSRVMQNTDEFTDPLLESEH